VTDLIARLAEKVSARRDYYERNMRHLGFVQTVEFTLEDAEACLHALKVQQAAEAYVDNLGAEKEWIHHANLVSAVKGEQP